LHVLFSYFFLLPQGPPHRGPVPSEGGCSFPGFFLFGTALHVDISRALNYTRAASTHSLRTPTGFVSGYSGYVPFASLGPTPPPFKRFVRADPHSKAPEKIFRFHWFKLTPTEPPKRGGRPLLTKVAGRTPATTGTAPGSSFQFKHLFLWRNCLLQFAAPFS